MPSPGIKPGLYIGGRRVLSALLHPCSPDIGIFKRLNFWDLHSLGQSLYICNVQLSWEASRANRDDGTGWLYCWLLWGSHWWVNYIQTWTYRSKIDHTTLVQCTELDLHCSLQWRLLQGNILKKIFPYLSLTCKLQSWPIELYFFHLTLPQQNQHLCWMSHSLDVILPPPIQCWASTHVCGYHIRRFVFVHQHCGGGGGGGWNHV